MATTDTNIEESLFQRLAYSISSIRSTIVAENSETDTVVWNLPGFSAKARVGTTFGDLPIEALRVRDAIRTISGAIARVQWVDKLHLDEDYIKKHPSACPIRIAANSFGAGRPAQEMIVSPRQEICPDTHAVTNFLRADELRTRFNAHRIQSAVGMTYFRFHCGEPVVVRVDGVWVGVRP
jgi:hypothetical protein